MENLKENRRLIERDELIRHLSDLEWNFSRTISDFLSRKTALSSPAAEEAPAEDRIGPVMERNEERSKLLESMGGAGSHQEEEPLVSSDELSELLKDFETK